MRRFLIEISFFAIPITFIVPLLFILHFSNELNFSEKDIKNKKEYLVGFRYSDGYTKLKMWEIKNSNPYEVWALGSSRVLQFRKHFFIKSFYNVGYTISQIQDFKALLSSIDKEKYPKLLIVGLDQWMFNSNWNNSTLESRPTRNYKDFTSLSKAFRGPDKQLIKDVIHANFEFSDLLLFNENRIGLDAKLNIKGFRKDGSKNYIKQINGLLSKSDNIKDFKYENTLDRIKKGDRRFQVGDSLNSEAIIILEDFIKFCAQYNICVVSFLPPFAKTVNEALINSKRHKYIFRINPILDNLSYKYNNWDHYNFTQKGPNEEMLDGFHGGELNYAKIVLSLDSANSMFSKYVNRDSLYNLIRNRKNNYDLCDK